LKVIFPSWIRVSKSNTNHCVIENLSVLFIWMPITAFPRTSRNDGMISETNPFWMMTANHSFTRDRTLLNSLICAVLFAGRVLLKCFDRFLIWVAVQGSSSDSCPALSLPVYDLNMDIQRCLTFWGACLND
jgi:hypothetical protein